MSITSSQGSEISIGLSSVSDGLSPVQISFFTPWRRKIQRSRCRDLGYPANLAIFLSATVHSIIASHTAASQEKHHSRGQPPLISIHHPPQYFLNFLPPSVGKLGIRPHSNGAKCPRDFCLRFLFSSKCPSASSVGVSPSISWGTNASTRVSRSPLGISSFSPPFWD